MMDTLKNPTSLIFLIVLVVVVNRFNQYYFEKNFLIQVKSPCDPKLEVCFAPTCESNELGCEPLPYKKVEIAANSAPACLEEHKCANFYCESNTQCNITYCDPIAGDEICFMSKQTEEEIKVPILEFEEE